MGRLKLMGGYFLVDALQEIKSAVVRGDGLALLVGENLVRSSLMPEIEIKAFRDPFASWAAKTEARDFDEFSLAIRALLLRSDMAFHKVVLQQKCELLRDLAHPLTSDGPGSFLV